MNLKSKIAVFFTCLAMNYSSWATGGFPGTCPSTEAIKSEGVALAYNICFDLYGAFQFSKYGTEKSWLFGLGPIEADNEHDAIGRANRLITTLSGHPTPVELEPGMWACLYQLADDDYVGVAYQTDNFSSPIKLKPYLMKKHQ